jgi:hypothetical protein
MIYMPGGAGWPNFGDEMIVNGWLQYFDGQNRGIEADACCDQRRFDQAEERDGKFNLPSMITCPSAA